GSPYTGETPNTVGTPSYRYSSAFGVAGDEAPLAFVTTTSAVPLNATDGIVTSSCVSERMEKVAEAPPTLTAVAPPKPAPVTVTWLPPLIAPASGSRLDTVGAPSKVNRSAGAVAELPALFVTITSTVPSSAGGV